MKNMIFSFVVDDEQQINKYQLVLRNYTRENGELLHKSNSGRHLKNEDLAYKAKLVLETLSADEICEFLEFHLSEFSGSNNEFLNWVVVCLENEYLSRIQPPGIGQLPSADYIFRNIRGDNSNPIATPMFNTIRNWVENKKNNIESPSVSNIAAKTGFKSTLMPEQIKSLFDQLKAAQPPFIDAQHGVENFAAIFSGEPDFKPVAWIDTAPKDKNTKNTQTLFELVNCLIPELTQPENASSLYDFIIERFKDNQENEYKRDNLKQAFKAWGKKKGASKPPRNKAIIDIFTGLK